MWECRAWFSSITPKTKRGTTLQDCMNTGGSASHGAVVESMRSRDFGLVFHKQRDNTHAQALCDLINRAYRGTQGEKRWTTEHHLVEGNRIGLDAVKTLIADASVSIIAGFNDDEPVCCIAIRERHSVVELGTFAVEPMLQGQGIGKALLSYAEQQARKKHKPLEVLVVNRNTALIEFYLKRAYVRTGEIRPYPLQEQVGLPKVEGLALVVLSKS